MGLCRRPGSKTRSMISHIILRALFFTCHFLLTRHLFACTQTSNTCHAIMRRHVRHDVTVCACIFFLSMREESRSRADKIELGDELVKILPDSFVEMSQEGSTCKNCSRAVFATCSMVGVFEDRRYLLSLACVLSYDVNTFFQ